MGPGPMPPRYPPFRQQPPMPNQMVSIFSKFLNESIV